MDKRERKPKPEKAPGRGKVQSRDEDDLAEGNASRGPQSEADDPIEQIEGVEDALTDMEAHEKRRDNTHRMTGDNHSPGVDVDLDSNAPKDLELSRKKRGGSRGAND
jgi:hypothetical protein